MSSLNETCVSISKSCSFYLAECSSLRASGARGAGGWGGCQESGRPPGPGTGALCRTAMWDESREAQGSLGTERAQGHKGKPSSPDFLGHVLSQQNPGKGKQASTKVFHKSIINLMCPPKMPVIGVCTNSAWRVTEVLFLGPTCSHSSSLPSPGSSCSSSFTEWLLGPLETGSSEKETVCLSYH